MTERLQQLKDLMACFQKQTPSAPDWYPVIDTVVGTLLALEIERLQPSEDARAGLLLKAARAEIGKRDKFTAKDMVAAIPDATPKQVHNMLGYLVRNKEVVRLTRGSYRKGV